MPKYILSHNAQESLRSIKVCSTETFGKRQTQAYLKTIDDRMRFVAEHPRKGRDRGYIKGGYYSISVGSHVIYYTIHDNHIGILDVLHQTMEPLLRL